MGPDAVLYADNHIIAVNKDWTELVQTDRTGDVTLAESVRAYLKDTYQKPGNVFLGTVHRLDRPTSGIVLFARTSKGLERMSRLFRERAVEKLYWAVTEQPPPDSQGVLTHYLTRDRGQNKSYATLQEVPDSKEAVLSYHHRAAARQCHLLEIRLHTGRHHQIRAQLGAVGCHIKGDVKYGAGRANSSGGIHLHARQVSFVHPVKNERVTIVAPPPDDELWNVFVAVVGTTC